ncbi:universal stress protein [Natrinema salifodinae]|uniref:Nucleotide-binding universal stress protein, UspA family n=1 Tax=Natrinema salifodinae TaxID=1202768 RepID=A0A1I0MK11_9EURY|nr:universal stress protein [Natrinema salifodinae]SEV88562.1 Nucleotide-binding universal stress protein, UspA family [Natrinema salifodinae]
MPTPFRILVPTDGSDPAAAALEHALDVAADRDATVHLLYVADTKEPSLTRLGTDVVDALEIEGQDILSDAADLADERGVTVTTDVVQGDPRELIAEFATADEYDLVAMGAHGRRGIGEYVLGSVTDYVVNRSDVPVLTVRAADDATQPFPYTDVLVPTDGSDHATAAVELGAEIGAHHGATLHLLSVVDEVPEVVDVESVQLSDQLEENLQAVLDEGAAIAERAGVDDVETTVATGTVPREVTSYADAEGIDLVVMGTHGHTGLDRHLLGSFTERLIRTSPVPVLTTREADESE